MMDLEQRVRRELHDLADSVRLPTDPRADFERRLTERPAPETRSPGRWPTMLAAAAAAVVAAVAIPMALNGNGPGGDPVRVSSSTPAAPPVQKVVLASVVDQGVESEAILTVDGEIWCLDIEYSTAPKSWCQTATWPRQADGVDNGWVLTQLVLGEELSPADTTPDRMLFVTAPAVSTLVVTDAAATAVPLREVATSENARFYLAEFPVTHEGFRFTAKDAAGNVLDTEDR